MSLSSFSLTISSSDFSCNLVSIVAMCWVNSAREFSRDLTDYLLMRSYEAARIAYCSFSAVMALICWVIAESVSSDCLTSAECSCFRFSISLFFSYMISDKHELFSNSSFEHISLIFSISSPWLVVNSTTLFS
jgi:hypothetical protein